MRTRSSIRERVMTVLMLAVLTLSICIPVSATTATTVLTTKVPSVFVVEVCLSGLGYIEINGVPVKTAESTQVERNNKVSIRFVPDGDSDLASVVFDGKDLTQDVKDGMLLLPALDKDCTLKVCFATKTQPPETGDHGFFNIMIMGIVCVLSATVIGVLLYMKKKMKQSE